MKYSLVVSARAENDLSESILWYENKQPGLGNRFFGQVKSLFKIIRQDPFRYPMKRPPYREAILPKFPFVIIYEIKKKEIVIFSVFNTYRNPKKKP